MFARDKRPFGIIGSRSVMRDIPFKIKENVCNAASNREKVRILHDARSTDFFGGLRKVPRIVAAISLSLACCNPLVYFCAVPSIL
jgi:hypothetical protein